MRTFEEVRMAVLGLSDDDQKRLITELVPQIWKTACLDETCVRSLRSLVDEDTVREYRNQHMGTI